jgi:hypothetical protein
MVSCLTRHDGPGRNLFFIKSYGRGLTLRYKSTKVEEVEEKEVEKVIEEMTIVMTLGIGG